MRTAAFVNAINKVHEYYSLTGINNWFESIVILISFILLINEKYNVSDFACFQKKRQNDILWIQSRSKAPWMFKLKCIPTLKLLAWTLIWPWALQLYDMVLKSWSPSGMNWLISYLIWMFLIYPASIPGFGMSCYVKPNDSKHSFKLENDKAKFIYSSKNRNIKFTF